MTLAEAQLEHLADLVAERLPVHDPGEWLSIDDVCAELKVSASHLTSAVSAKKMPGPDLRIGKGGKKIWLRSTVDQVKRGVEAGEISL